MWDLVPWPGIEPRPPALAVQSLSHWTTRKFPPFLFEDRKISFFLLVSSYLKKYPHIVCTQLFLGKWMNECIHAGLKIELVTQEKAIRTSHFQDYFFSKNWIIFWEKTENKSSK